MRKTTIWAVTCVIALATFFTPLSPIIQSANAQYRAPVTNGPNTRPRAVREAPEEPLPPFTRYRPTSKPGQDEYYKDDRVRYSATNASYPHRSEWQRVDGDPQVPEGAQMDIAAYDEEDVLASQVIQEQGGAPIYVETMSGSGELFLRTLPTKDRFGRDVYVRRIKLTRKIIATVNCGNWTRQVGAGYVYTQDNTCKDFNPNAQGVPNKDDKGNIVSYYYNFGCNQEVTVPVTTVQLPGDCPVCVPGEAYAPLLLRVGGQLKNADESNVFPEKELKKAKLFTLQDVAPQILDAVVKKFGPQKDLNVYEQLKSQDAQLANLKFKYLHIVVDPCALKKGTYSFLFEGITAEGHHFNWKKFFIIVGIIVAAVVIITVLHSSPKELIKIPPVRISPGMAIAPPRENFFFSFPFLMKFISFI